MFNLFKKKPSKELKFIKEYTSNYSGEIKVTELLDIEFKLGRVKLIANKYNKTMGSYSPDFTLGLCNHKAYLDDKELPNIKSKELVSIFNKYLELYKNTLRKENKLNEMYS